MQVSKYITADALIQELHDEGHDVIYERITEYPVLKGVLGSTGKTFTHSGRIRRRDLR
jgi:hypothetical protein